jgi:hypothetical protein
MELFPLPLRAMAPRRLSLGTEVPKVTATLDLYGVSRLDLKCRTTEA